MILDKAKAWAAAGWPVFPIYSTGPIKHWEQLATTDIAAFDWTNAAMVGCVPGLAGCWVLDVDMKNGKDGEASLRQLEKEHGFETWDTPRQRTPSSGVHLFFRGVSATTTGTLGMGLDTRGGSSAGGLGFIFCHAERPPAAVETVKAAPPSLVALVGRPRERADRIADEPTGGWDLPANVRRAERYLAAVQSEGEGGRNAKLFLHACKVRDLGVSEGKLHELLAEHPAALGDPALDEDEAATTIDSAYRNGQLDAGNAAASGDLDRIAAEAYAAQPGPKRRRLALWSERRDRPPPPWLVDKLLPAGGLVGLYGQGGSYKTFLALRLGVAIAKGEATFGGRTLAQGPVVYVAGEGQQEPRLRAIEAEFGTIPDTFALFDGLDLTSEEDQAILAADLQLAISGPWGGRMPALIVVDTLNRAAPGADENSAKDMGLVVAACDAMRKALGCTVLLVHHTPKGSDDWRGSTAVWNALDAALLVKRKGDLKAVLYARRIKDAPDGAAWDIGLRTRDQSIVVTSVREQPEAPASEGRSVHESKAASQQRMRESLLNDARGKVAKDILVTSGVITPRTLCRQMIASLGDEADAESIRQWLRGVIKRGGVLNEDHPLASCVATLAPLAFTAPITPRPDVRPEPPPA